MVLAGSAWLGGLAGSAWPDRPGRIGLADPSLNFRRFSVELEADFRGFASLTARALLGPIFEPIFVLFRGFLARASRLFPKGPTLTKHRYGRCFVRVGLPVLEPKVDRNSLRERFPNDLREHPKIINSGENQ